MWLGHMGCCSRGGEEVKDACVRTCHHLISCLTGMHIVSLMSNCDAKDDNEFENKKVWVLSSLLIVSDVKNDNDYGNLDLNAQ